MISSSAKPSVLHVVAVPMTAALLVQPIIKRQIALGYSVEIACNDGEFIEQVRSFGCPVHIVPISRKLVTVYHVFALLSLYRLMRRRCFDVVHTHTPIASFIGRIAAWLAGVKCIIYHVRGTWWGTSVLGSVMMTCAEYFPGRITTHAFTVNCSDARDLVRYRIMGNSQVTCLHCGAGGIELESFNFNQYNEETRLRTRKDLSIHKDDLVVTFIGRLVRDKGVNELVRAMVQVRTKVPNAKLLLIGGVLTSERRDHAFDEDVETILLDPNFIAVGFRTDVARLLHASDIVVLPSYHEGFGTVIAEAAAMGKPAVMTATRGSYEVIVDGETGFRVPIAEVNPLAEAIEKILVDTDLRNRMGVAARKLAESRFDANKVFQVIEQRYRVLLGATAGVESTL